MCGDLLTNANWRPGERRRDWKRCKRCLSQIAKDRRVILREQARRYRAKVRGEVIAAYGGRCTCCGEDTPEFLTIDHIYNDGAAHRKTIGNGKTSQGSSEMYPWLKRNGFPKDRFQLLCMNCNCAKAWFGTCPHQRPEIDY